MEKEYVYDTEEVQELLNEYAEADSQKEEERIEAAIGEKLTSTVEAYDLDLPSDGELLSMLTDLHRETEDDEILNLIEKEIGCIAFDVPVKIPKRDPVAEPTTEEIMSYLDVASDQETARYLRLRVFQTLDAWDSSAQAQNEEVDEPFTALSDDDLQYLHSALKGPASWFAKEELTDRVQLGEESPD